MTIVRLPRVMPTPERLNHDGGLKLNGGTYFAKESCKLDTYLKRDIINDKQHEVGMIMFRTFCLANISRGSSMNLEEIKGGSSDFTDRQLQARQKIDKAFATLTPRGRTTVWYICCEDQDLREVDKRLGAPYPTSRIVLQESLEVLVKHFFGRG